MRYRRASLIIGNKSLACVLFRHRLLAGTANKAGARDSGLGAREKAGIQDLGFRTKTEAASAPPGIVDVHSGAPGDALDGTPFASW